MLNGKSGRQESIVIDDKSENNHKKMEGWIALDPASEFSTSKRKSQNDKEDRAAINNKEAMVIVRDSFNVNISSQETQVAVSLQAALQAAITLAVNMAVDDTRQAEKITYDLLQVVRANQANLQGIYVKNSRDVTIQMTDTQSAVTIELMLQLLLALLIELDVI